MKQGFNILIPDGENYNLFNIIYCLSRIKNVRIYVMSDKKRNALSYSRFIKKLTYYPKTSDDSQWILYVNEEMRKCRADLILPIYEVRLRTLIKHQRDLIAPEKLVILPSLQNFDTANNKRTLAKHLVEHSIPGPKSSTVESPLNWESSLKSISFPLLIKPTQHTDSGIGIQKFENRDALKAYNSTNTQSYPIFIQEFIEGEDYGCNLLCENGKILAYSIQKGFLWEKKPYSPQVGLKLVKESLILEKMTQLVKSLNWSGVAHVDLIYDPKSKQYYVLEINPRYWSSIVGSLVGGLNFPWLHSLVSIGRELEPPEYALTEFLNLKGLFIKIRMNPVILIRFRFLWNNTTLKYVILDPLPVLSRFIWRSRNLLAKRLSRIG